MTIPARDQVRVNWPRKAGLFGVEYPPTNYTQGVDCVTSLPVAVWTLTGGPLDGTFGYDTKLKRCLSFTGPVGITHGRIIDPADWDDSFDCATCYAGHAYANFYDCTTDALIGQMPWTSVLDTAVLLNSLQCAYTDFIPVFAAPDLLTPITWYVSCADCIDQNLYIQAVDCHSGLAVDLWGLNIDVAGQVWGDGATSCISFTGPTSYTPGTIFDPAGWTLYADCAACLALIEFTQAVDCETLLPINLYGLTAAYSGQVWSKDADGQCISFTGPTTVTPGPNFDGTGYTLQASCEACLNPPAPCAYPAGNPPAGMSPTYTEDYDFGASPLLTWDDAAQEWNNFNEPDPNPEINLYLDTVNCKWLLAVLGVGLYEKLTGLTPAGTYTKVSGTGPATVTVT